MRAAAAIIVPLVALGGVALSIYGGVWRDCVETLHAAGDDSGACGPWVLHWWWGMTASAALFLAAVAAVVLAWRTTRRALWVLATLVALAALLPLPIDLWRENDLRHAIEDLV